MRALATAIAAVAGAAEELPLPVAPTPLATTAFVFVGHARSFARPAVHRSIKTHLVDALGGARPASRLGGGVAAHARTLRDARRRRRLLVLFRGPAVGRGDRPRATQTIFQVAWALCAQRAGRARS